MKNKINEFSVMVYGNFEKYNEVISKARCRIFYKGANRNGTYITDEFAENLIKTIPYTPVKGIYDGMNGDYTDHGERRDEGRIYGVVPENPNFAWEDHEDEDGVVRTYATVDVLIFTALYAEATEIAGKAQSMELYAPSIKGQWKIIGGKRLYEYSEGCFLGLQVLGDDVEPCFEGAAFFSFCDSLKQLVDRMEQFNLKFQEEHTGGTEMTTINFKLSDSQKQEALWQLLNTNYTEEGNWVVDYGIYEVYDNYAVCRNYAEQSFERVYFEKDDENDSLSISKKEKCFIVDVSESEKQSLRTIQALNNNTYEKIDEQFSANAEKVTELEGQIGELNTQVENLTTEKSENEQKIGELNTQISTLNTEKETFTQQINDLTAEKATFEGQIQELSSYKANIEKNQKAELINTYANKLDQEILDEFTAKIDEYEYEALDKDLAYALVKKNPSIFSLDPKEHTPNYIPKDNDTMTGIEAILSQYKK